MMTPPDADTVRDLLALQLIPGIGPRLTKALLERFGSAAAVRQAPVSQLREVPHIGPKLAAGIVASLSRNDVEAELQRIAQHGVRLLVLGHADYPAPLVDIHDPPQLLYLRGTYEARDVRAVAIVGSRSCTGYGRRVAERLATGLSRAGFTIVSGLARGIDAVAHRAALQAGGRTLAVVAGGLSRIYPPEHAELAREIETNGGLLTESAMEQQPLAHLFPGRNRIISGLAKGVIVVEAAERSGALLTVGHALEQGREVFAVPGSVESALSAGTNALIRKGATLVRDADDVLQDLGGLPSMTPPADAKAEPLPDLEPIQRQVWDFLAEQPRHIDEIIRRFGLSVAEAGRHLMTLEMKRVIRRLPGNQYERRRS